MNITFLMTFIVFPIVVFGQTNLTKEQGAQLERRHYKALERSIQWGEETNGLKAGFFCGNGCDVFVMSTTNRWLVRPLPSQTLKMTLLDKHGKEVSKKKAGEVLGQELRVDSELVELARRREVFLSKGRTFILQTWPELLANLKITDFFRIPAPGNYDLKIEVRLMDLDPAGKIVFIYLPPVTNTVTVYPQKRKKGSPIVWFVFGAN